MESRQIAILLVSIVLGFIFSAVFTPVFVLLRKIIYVPFIRGKLLRNAIKGGHIVNAKLVDSIDVQQSNGSFGNTDTFECIGIYKYEYDEKVYTHRVISRDRLPEEMELYYQKNPGRATSGGDLGLRESNWFLYFAVIWLVLVILLFFGYYLYGFKAFKIRISHFTSKTIWEKEVFHLRLDFTVLDILA